jgi:hypothetical protein
MSPPCAVRSWRDHESCDAPNVRCNISCSHGHYAIAPNQLARDRDVPKLPEKCNATDSADSHAGDTLLLHNSHDIVTSHQVAHIEYSLMTHTSKTHQHPPRAIAAAATAAMALLSIIVAPAHAQTAADSTAIRATAMDYIEGWYAGDAARMERALHPELAKRVVTTDPSMGRSQLESIGAMTLVLRTRAGGGSRTPPERQQKDFRILDVFNNAAVAKIVASDWVDYLELAKWNGRWLIVNVLWEYKPKSR